MKAAERRTRPHNRPARKDDKLKAGLESRQVAAKLLAAVVDRHVSLDGLLDSDNGNAAYRALDTADRALVRAMLVTALRHLPTVEAILSRYLEKPLPEGARALHFALVIAATQILYLDVPDRAAVDLAVEQAGRDPRSRRFAPLVNALLRRLSREKDAVLPETEARVLNAPPWFVDRLTALYGAEHAAAIVAAHQRPAPIDLTVRKDAAGWAEKLGGTLLPTGSVRLPPFEGSVVELPGFSEGAWWVQDAAASIPARLMGDIAGKRIADLCAAPGGKTAQLAAQGAAVTAFDLSANRLKRLQANLVRLHLEAECVTGDFMTVAPESAFDAVLLDAPCSSTGTVRRHPDVPWTKGEGDIEKLARLQEKMLRRALTLVKPGGRVVFANCSLDRKEGEEVVERVLADTPNVALAPVDPADWPGLEEAITPAGMVRTTPAMLDGDAEQSGGLDGFFAVVFVRQC